MIPLIVNITAPHQDGILDSFASPGAGIDPDFVFRDIMLAFYHRPVVPTQAGTPPWQDDWLNTDTFQMTVGNRDAQPTGGTFPIGVLAGMITANSIAASTVITTGAAHNLVSTNKVLIFGSNSTPNIDGLYAATVTDATHFTIPVTVTVAGTAGSVYDATGLDALTWNEAVATFTSLLNTILTKHSFANVAGTLLSAGQYNLIGTTNGAIPSLYSPTTNALIPQSGVAVTVVAAGSASSEAQQIVTLYQAPVAYSEPATPLPAAALGVSIAQAGDGTHNKIYTIALTAGTYGGTFSTSVTIIGGLAGTYGVIASGGVSANDFQTALVQATGLQNTDFNVTRVNDVINVEFAGTQGVSNVPVLSAVNIDLVAPLGVSGFINFNTIALFEAFAAAPVGTNELTFTLSIRRTRASGEQAEYLIVDVILKRNLVQGVALIPVPMPSYYTQDQANALFARLAVSNTFTENNNFDQQSGQQLVVTGANYPDGFFIIDTDNRVAKIGDNNGDNNSTSITADDSAENVIINANNGTSITGGNLAIGTAGKTLTLTTGANAKAGTFTLVAGAATIANTSVTANSVIQYSLKTVGGTIAADPYIATQTPTTGFTVAGGGALNTSVYSYIIFEIT